MRKHTRIVGILAALLAVYAAAGMCRTAASISKEGKRAETLTQACQSTADEIAALKREMDACPETVRRLAWRQLGMVSPGDVVFFDGG